MRTTSDLCDNFKSAAFGTESASIGTAPDRSVMSLGERARRCVSDAALSCSAGPVAPPPIRAAPPWQVEPRGGGQPAAAWQFAPGRGAAAPSRERRERGAAAMGVAQRGRSTIVALKSSPKYGAGAASGRLDRRWRRRSALRTCPECFRTFGEDRGRSQNARRSRAPSRSRNSELAQPICGCPKRSCLLAADQARAGVGGPVRTVTVDENLKKKSPPSLRIC